MPNTTDLRAVGDRIEALLQELGAFADPRVREKAEELVRLLMELYGAGLARIASLIKHGESEAKSILERCVDDELVASLFILHGLHPLDVETRLRRALDRVRPALGLHGGDVTLLGIQNGVVRLRLEGSCHGCPSSTVTMRLTIERALAEVAPEVTRIEVAGTTVDTAPQQEWRYQECPVAETAS